MPKSRSRAATDCDQRQSEDSDHARNRVTHDPLSSDQCQSDPQYLRNESTDSSDPQPLTRPKHPPSYNNSLSRNAMFQQPHAAFHSSAKKRTCQQAVLRPQDQSLTTLKSPIKLTGKRANSESETSRNKPASGRGLDGSLVLGSDPAAGCENQMPTNGSSCCWQNDLQEMRIREEYERKKLEKDQLLVKASGLEAEIAVCRQKIQLLNDQIRGKTLLSLQFLL